MSTWAAHLANSLAAKTARIEALEAERDALAAEVERLNETEDAVLAVINIYGDDVLHSALDGIGYRPRSTPATEEEAP